MWQTKNNNNGILTTYQTFGNDVTEFLATVRMGDNGIKLFDVVTFDTEYRDIPLIWNYKTYMEMARDAQIMLLSYPNGYVCHVAHSAPNAYVLIHGDKEIYIRTEE